MNSNITKFHVSLYLSKIALHNYYQRKTMHIFLVFSSTLPEALLIYTQPMFRGEMINFYSYLCIFLFSE